MPLLGGMQALYLNQSGDAVLSSRIAFQFVARHTDEILAFLRVRVKVRLSPFPAS